MFPQNRHYLNSGEIHLHVQLLSFLNKTQTICIQACLFIKRPVYVHSNSVSPRLFKSSQQRAWNTIPVSFLFNIHRETWLYLHIIHELEICNGGT
jgi:hypothetical protein